MGNGVKKNLGRKWGIRIILLVIIVLLLLRCGGKPGTMLSGDGGAPPLQEKQGSPHATAPAPPPVQPVRNKENPASPEVPVLAPDPAVPTPTGADPVPVKGGVSEKGRGGIVGRIQQKTPQPTGSLADDLDAVEQSPVLDGKEENAGTAAGPLPVQAAPDIAASEKTPPEEHRRAQGGLPAGSGSPGSLLGGAAGASFLKAGRPAFTVSAPASAPVRIPLNESSAMLKDGVPQEEMGEPGGKTRQKEAPTLSTGGPGSRKARTEPAPDLTEASSSGPQSDRTIEGAAAEGEEPKRVERRRTDAVAIKDAEKAEKERPSAGGAALAPAAGGAYEIASGQPGVGTETAPVQPRQLSPGGKGLTSAAQKPMEQPAESKPLQHRKKEEGLPGESPGYPEGGFVEVAIPDAGYVPMCPGRPDGPAAEGEDPAGKTFTDPVTGMSFVLVKGGCFEMGSNTGGRDEWPVHEVCVDDFYMGAYEVTQAQYEWIMENNPSAFKSCGLPVESVSWEDAQAYIRKLKEAGGRDYRLPSEAEWEYAARSGWREEAKSAVDEALLMEYAGYVRNMGRQTGPDSGANGWGLYGMTGNVWEWVSDWYGARYYGSSPRSNPQGPPAGAHRVLRAGTDGRFESQFAKRYGAPPDESQNYFGFRLVFPARTLAEGAAEDRASEMSDSTEPGSRDEAAVTKMEPAAGPESLRRSL